MFKILTTAVLLTLSGAAFAQMDADEAMQKMKEREIAATQVSNDPQVEVAHLKSVIADQAKEIDVMKAQIAQLLSQNSSLKKQIAANPPPAANAGPNGAKIWKGMTKAQIMDAIGTPTLDRTDSDGTETIEWNRLVAKHDPQLMDSSQAWMAMQSGPQLDPKFAWSLNHYITAYLTNGKVTDFTDQQQN